MPKAKWEMIADLMYDYFQLEENFSRKDIEDIVVSYNLSDGTIRANTWKALFTHNVLSEISKDLYKLLPRVEVKKAPKTTNKNASKTLNIKKAYNQYYGQYVEEAVVAIINNKEIPNNITDYIFQDWEIDIMNEDAKAIANYLNSSTAEYVGRHTSSANCDIIADNREVELKYSKDNGTFYNTSVSYFDQFGLTPFKQYMFDYGVLSFLANYFGDKVYNNLSPVNANEGSKWVKENPELYEQLKEIEAKARDAYVTQVYNYLIEDSSRIEFFAKQMLTKESSGKHTPDLILIYHYNNDKIVTFTKDEVLAMTSGSMTRSGYTFKFPGFHTTIAWQNGTGLNNPTIRVYLDKKGE